MSLELCLGNRGQAFLLSALNAPHSALQLLQAVVQVGSIRASPGHHSLVSTLATGDGWSYPYAACYIDPWGWLVLYIKAYNWILPPGDTDQARVTLDLDKV